jgi:hypothetical protein
MPHDAFDGARERFLDGRDAVARGDFFLVILRHRLALPAVIVRPAVSEDELIAPGAHRFLVILAEMQNTNRHESSRMHPNKEKRELNRQARQERQGREGRN